MTTAETGTGRVESMQGMEAHVQVQAARILESIQTLDTQYSDWIAENDPELARRLSDAATSLDQILSLANARITSNS